MTILPLECYSVKQIRALEELAIKNGISAAELMQRAGQGVFQTLMARFPGAQHLIVLCGGGNNAGDGYIVAALAKAQGLQVTLYALADYSTLPGVAREAAERAIAAGVVPETWSSGAPLHADVIVDALFGIGFQGDVRAPYDDVIARLFDSVIPVISIDVPSGINADTGDAAGVYVSAECTVTFVGVKQGLLTGKAKHACGDIVVHDLNLPATILAEATISALLSDRAELPLILPRRRRDASKNKMGHVLVIGGDYGMPGAARLAAEAAARTGAGLTTVATHREHIAVMCGSCPELMCHSVESADELDPLLQRATVIVLGPGLGESPWSETLFQKVMLSSQPKVIDASALTLLAKHHEKYSNAPRNWVLTPHPGEAARLLNCEVAEIQRDRFAAVKALQKKYGGVVVLKGAGSLTQAGDELTEICVAGNPGMASGGMGDCLSGIIAALIAQGVSLFDAARAGVSIHAEAADLSAAEMGERGMLASDLFPYIRLLINDVF